MHFNCTTIKAYLTWNVSNIKSFIFPTTTQQMIVFCFDTCIAIWLGHESMTNNSHLLSDKMHVKRQFWDISWLCPRNLYFFFHLLSQRVKIAPVHAVVFLRFVDVLYHKKRPFNYRANSRHSSSSSRWTWVLVYFVHE